MRWIGILGICAWIGMAGLATQSALGQWNTPNPVVSFEKRADGLDVRQKNGILRLVVNSEDVLHVTYSPLGAASPERASDWVVVKKDWPGAPFEASSTDKAIVLSTAKLKAVIEKESGALHYVRTEGVTGSGATGPGSTGGQIGRAHV